MTYTKVPTWDVQRMPWWYAYVTSSFDTQAGPLAGSASQIACGILGKDRPN